MYIIPTGTARFQSHWNKCKRTHIGVFNDRLIKEIFWRLNEVRMRRL